MERSARRRRSLDPRVDTFDASDPKMRHELVQVVLQFLEEEGFPRAAVALEEEARMRNYRDMATTKRYERLQRVVLEGDWVSGIRILKKLGMDNTQLHWILNRQQYLELIDNREVQKALSFLRKYIKPLEHIMDRDEFRDVCSLLSCESVRDIERWRDWKGVGAEREKLADMLDHLAQVETFFEREYETDQFPPKRLVHLVQQATAYQIEFSRYPPKLRAPVQTLKMDYSSYIVPNTNRTTFKGHRDSVKCLAFLGASGRIASGSGDHTVQIWDSSLDTTTESTQSIVLSGHRARIWDLSASRRGDLLLSCSGDATAMLWDPQLETTLQTFVGHDRDVYACSIHPNDTHVLTGGYDHAARLFDIETGACLLNLTEHESSITSVVFNPFGNLAITGSRDRTVRFWDMTSGICIKRLEAHSNDVTSIACDATGGRILTSSKDNSNRLWDARKLVPLQRYRGHQNSFKNFIRSSFGPSESVVVGGSEDGFVYLWHIESGQILQRLQGHRGTVYDVAWDDQQELLVSCGQDQTVKSWAYDC